MTSSAVEAEVDSLVKQLYLMIDNFTFDFGKLKINAMKSSRGSSILIDNEDARAAA